MERRAIRINFTREALLRQPFSIKLFQEMLSRLPEGTSLLGFSEDYSQLELGIVVSHTDFPVVQEGQIIPQVYAVFERDSNRNPKFKNFVCVNQHYFKDCVGFTSVSKRCMICGASQ